MAVLKEGFIYTLTIYFDFGNESFCMRSGVSCAFLSSLCIANDTKHPSVFLLWLMFSMF